MRWSGWRFEGVAGGLEFEEADVLPDEVKRLEVKEREIADDPLKWQSAVHKAVMARGRRARKPGEVDYAACAYGRSKFMGTS